MKTNFFCLLLCLLTVHSVQAGNWAVVRSPNVGRQANTLFGVATAGDNDIWAIGAAFNQRLFAYRTVIEHWDGTSWSVVRSPNATNGYNLLNGVAVVAANDVWTVGQAAIGSIYSTLVEHWNGTAWSIIPSPNVVGNSSILQAVTVTSANDIWAVGYSIDSNFDTHPLTMHWDGSAWSIVDSPGIFDDILYAVDAIAGNDVWAVGRSKDINTFEDITLTMHWDGSLWSIVPSPNDSDEDNVLFGVAAISSSEIWAVGNAGSLKTLALRWDGGSWSIVPTPGFDDNTSNEVLVGIVAVSSTNIWTAGQFTLPLQGSAEQTLTEDWNGSIWSVVSSPNAKNSNNRLSSIAVTPNGTLWSVGTTGVFGKAERTLVLRKTP